jgi:signal transduction histidine kinase
MLDRLDAAYSSQLRFVSDASHELRTPIAVIQGYSNLLDRWGKNDEKTLQEAIDAIKTEAAGMQDLVEQLLFLARSDNQSITLSVEVVDAAALAEVVFRETQMID